MSDEPVDVTYIDFEIDEEDERSPDLIPACSNNQGEIMTVEALVQLTIGEDFEDNRAIVAWLDAARAGGRNGGFIEPVVDALAERTGMPKARILELERGSRSYMVDLGSLVREAVIELWRQYPHAAKWVVDQQAGRGGRTSIQHVRLVTSDGLQEPLDLEWWMAEVFFDSRTNWMQMELAVDLVAQVVTAAGCIRPIEVAQSEGA